MFTRRKTIKGYLLFILGFTVITLSRFIFERFFNLQSLSNVLFSLLLICWFSTLWDRLVIRRDWICMALIACNMILLLLFMVLKYHAFEYFSDLISRHLWYAYYIPVTAIPLLSYYISKKAGHDYDKGDRILFSVLAVIWLLLVTGIMLNDRLQWAFGFNEGFVGWSDDYSHKWLYYLAVFWIVFLQASSFFIILFKSSLPNIRKKNIYVLLPAGLGAIYFIFYFFGVDPEFFSVKIFSFGSAYILTLIGVFEGCLRMGLIPSNDYYEEFFANSSASAVIVDNRNKEIYRTKGMDNIEVIYPKAETPARFDEKVIVSEHEIYGGHVIVANDVSRIVELKEELEDVREMLDQEALIIRNEHELKREYASLKTRNELYDRLSKILNPQLKKINDYISSDEDFINNLSKVCVLGTYVKRRSNLSIIAQENRKISIFEFVLAVNESVEYLRLNGVKVSVFTTSVFELSSEMLISLYEIYEEIIEKEKQGLKTVYIEISEGDSYQIMFMYTSDCLLSEDDIRNRLSAGFTMRFNREDSDTAIILNAKKEVDHE